MNKIESIIGNNENAFSIVIAALISYNTEIKKLFLRKANFPESLVVDEIITEKCLDSNENRIDIYVELESGYVIGVENKKWAKFQLKQIERYKESSVFKNNSKAKVVIVTPSRYDLSEHLDEICISYKEILDIVNKYQRDELMLDIKDFLSEVELMPLSLPEIDAQIYFGRSNKKLDSVLYELSGEEKIAIENNDGYKLFLKNIGNYSVYIGFRFRDDTEFYIKDKLLKAKPECIVYVKEYKNNYLSDKKNDEIFIKIEECMGNITQDGKADLLKGKGPVKIIIRKNIEDSIGYDLKNMSDWYRNIIDIMERVLT